MQSLRKLRNEMLLTQGEVAYKLGVTPETYNRLELGKHMPRVGLIRRLAEFYGVDPGELRDALTKAVVG